MTVANSSHDRIVTNPISVAGSLQNVPSQASNGTPFASTLTVNVASAALLGNEYGCTAAGGFAANSMSGKIALIQRGPPAPATACGFSEKVNNAAAAGAIGVVIYDRTTGTPLVMDVTTTPTTIPAVFIRQAAGYAIRDFLATNPNALMTLVAPSLRLIDSSVSDVLNASSLRGPNTTFDVTKPDITGPGTNIYAATSDNFGQYGFLTGTSMSSPHLAGAAALIRSAQPTWTPQEVKSAIQLTASPTGRKEDELTPWNSDDVGNGRIDLTKAARSGLVMNETFANFLAANPTSGNPNLARQLNLPSMRHVTVAGSYAFTRTFRNASGKALTWEAVTTGAPAGTTVTVTPSTFTFGADPLQTQTVTITVTLNQALAAPTFGSVTFRPTTVYAHGFEDGPQFPNPARLTLTVQGNP
jgi:subtilisin family serine protease